jgi:Sulfotransferase family
MNTDINTERPTLPIFVGGTGRSGTTIVGRLLGRHPDYEIIPVEARFHSSQDGLPAVLAGKETPETFVERVIEKWYLPPGGSPKLAAFVERGALDAALSRFLEMASVDLYAAARTLIEELFDGYARSVGKSGWVEMTPPNVLWGAPCLAQLFPELRLVHVVRDGRDVACSLVNLGWVPDIEQALRWWETRMLQAHQLCKAVPPRSLHAVSFERLMLRDRTASLRGLLDFLGWTEAPDVERFFERRMKSEDAHVGRWQTDLSGRERKYVCAEYEAILVRLRADEALVPF